MEAFGLGAFMVSACLVTALFEHPASQVRAALPSGVVRRVLIGVAMGLTAMAIIYSPWGKRSGAHVNPAVTLTFWRLGRVAPWDAVFYVAAQFLGGAAGVLVSWAALPGAIGDPSVHFVVTVPGEAGIAVAVACDGAISFVLMVTVLVVSASRWSRYTGVVAGCLVAAYIALEAPYSGMSMNPARTVASAIVAGEWTACWLYVVAPPVAMLLAAEIYVRTAGWARVACAKLRHTEDVRCIFCGLVPGAGEGE
jgi:aquaporin Z